MSPVVVKCSECGEILREDNGYMFGITYMQETIDRFSGKCPKCGYRLRLPPKNVEVKPNPACKKRMVGDWKHDYHSVRNVRLPLATYPFLFSGKKAGLPEKSGESARACMSARRLTLITEGEST